MRITFDPDKREKTLRERGLDFLDAKVVFAGVTLDWEDTRETYGETRIVSVGLLRGRMVVIAWTPRGDARHVFSMRKANEREQRRFGPRLR